MSILRSVLRSSSRVGGAEQVTFTVVDASTVTASIGSASRGTLTYRLGGGAPVTVWDVPLPYTIPGATSGSNIVAYGTATAFNYVPDSPYLGLSGTHDYYIDAANGDDSNDGTTSETAWATMSKITNGLMTAGEETKILVKSGTYDTALDYVDVFGPSGANLIIAFEPGCVMDGTAANSGASENGFEFNGPNTWSTVIFGNGLTVQNYVDASGSTSPNGFGNRQTHHLTVYDAYVDNCEDGFSCHGDATMITYDCSAVNCTKGAFLHVDNAMVEHHRCYFEINTAPGNNGANLSTVSMTLADCVIVGAANGYGFKLQPSSTVMRCQIGDATQRIDIDGAGATITDSYLNVYTDGDDYHTFRRCYGKFSARCRTPGGLDMQDCVIVGPATGQSGVIFSNFNSGGNIAMTFSGNVVATSGFMSIDATNAGYLLGGSATFADNSLWNSAAYDTDLDPSLISGTITTDPQIGSADSYLMADYASAAGLAGFGAGDVVERPANIPRALP